MASSPLKNGGFLIIFGALAILYFWDHKVQTVVPDPYLDEFFHVRQAKIWIEDGRWDVWDPKITTPPGLYLVSFVLLSACKSLGLWSGPVTATTLRQTNFYASIVLILLVRELLRLIVRPSSVEDDDRTREGDHKQALVQQRSHVTANVFLFPPLFFFCGLYYTDLTSALSVLFTYYFYIKKRRVFLVVAGLVSLFFRQTNIFWVSIFLGGLEVSRVLRTGQPGVDLPAQPTAWDVISGSWHRSCVYDPLVSQASFEDYIKTAVSVAVAGAANLHTITSCLAPYLSFLGAFGCFVVWNGGVVLGDKENHIASLHLPQMLYIWPYFMFFSSPLLYPYVLNSIIPQSSLPASFRSGSTKHQLPRAIVVIPIMATMLAIVHFNTIAHPFTLADNRHYVFYVFRILLRHPSIKYLAVPIYFICAWAAITALGGLPSETQNMTPQFIKKKTATTKPSTHSIPAQNPPRQGNTVTFVLVWLLATSLSLITAPLVEPRYFIVPWLMWRIHVPHLPPRQTSSDPATTNAKINPAKPKTNPAKARKEPMEPLGQIKASFYAEHDHRLWLETAWFLAVNWITAYMFLYRGFEWKQEPGRVQRFMW